MDFLERVGADPPARAHSGRRRGHLPRLRRRGLLRAVARAARARLRGLRTAREPWAAGRRVGRGREVLCRRLRRRIDSAGLDGGRAARPPLLVRDRQVARHWPHGLRSGRDRRLPSGVERQARRDQAEAGGRVVRPLLGVWRDETEAYCEAVGLPFRSDSTNMETKRGLIRDRIIPLLRQLDERAEKNLLALAEGRSSARCLDGECRRLGAGRPRRRCAGPCDAVTVSGSNGDPVELRGEVRWGPWRISSSVSGLQGPRLARRGPARQPVEESFRMSSWTPRFRAFQEAWPPRGARRTGRRCAGMRRGGRSGS